MHLFRVMQLKMEPLKLGWLLPQPVNLMKMFRIEIKRPQHEKPILTTISSINTLEVHEKKHVDLEKKPNI